MLKILILCLLVLILFINQTNYIQKIKKPIFFTSIETRDYLKNDKDKFVKSLNKINLIARKCISSEEYISKISQSCLDFSKKEKEKISFAYLDACSKFLNYSDNFLNKYGFKREKLEKLLNKNIYFGLTKNREYELGMPHTRENIIFLTTYYLKNNIDNSKKLIKTFIHEIIHLYQRFFRKEYNIYLKQKGWTIVTLNNKKYNRKRLNPDLDDKIWKRKGKIYIVEFSSDTPKSLDDLKNNQPHIEHPYEYYAYKISNLMYS